MKAWIMTTLHASLRMFILIIVGISLSACLGVNKPVKTERYSLPEIALPERTVNPTRRLLLQPVILADFLDTDRMMLQLDDIRLQPTRDHLWADMLSVQLNRALTARLANQLTTIQVSQSAPNPSTTSMYLQITINQFQGHMHGYAITSGEWQLSLPKKGDSLSQTFKLQTPLEQNGYPALVRALGNNLDLLAAQISQAVLARSSQLTHAE